MGSLCSHVRTATLFLIGYIDDASSDVCVFRSFSKNDLIVEYIGQKIRQVVADKREAVYEQEGVGSCYLFRLDKDEIVDATRTGGMARFMNHCCEPNAYAGIVTIPSNVNPSVCQEASTSAVPTDPHVGKNKNLLCSGQIRIVI